jgi:hypothetical protein
LKNLDFICKPASTGETGDKTRSSCESNILGSCGSKVLN